MESMALGTSVNLGTALGQALLVLIPMILSLTVHEFAHAWAARGLGDDTAEQMGRFNLNPLSHIDPVGTVLLPLVFLMAGSMSGGARLPFFGWARPVPYDPRRFRRAVSVRWGTTWVAAAGPLSNLVLAIASAMLLALGLRGVLPLPAAGQHLCIQMVQINVALFVFNLLPIAPLDGQKVVSGFLSPSLAWHYERFNQQYGTFLLIGIIFIGRGIILYPVLFVTRTVLSLVGLN